MLTTNKITINDGFNTWLIHVKGHRTIETYNYYLKHYNSLIDFFKSNNINYFNDINISTFDLLIVFLRNKNLSNTTINKYLTTIKVCINFLNNRYSTNYFIPRNIRLTETKPRIEIIEMEVLTKILDYLNKINNDNMKLCFLLMLTTGIRRTEITKIKVNNIDLNNNQIYLEDTKNHKPRFIYILNDEIKLLVSKVMNQIINQEYLLYSSKSKDYATPSTISSYFTKIKKDLKLKTLSPHKLRHTYATFLINNSADMNSVRLLLGHSSLYMTQRYIQMNNNQLKDINNKFNPLNDLK